MKNDGEWKKKEQKVMRKVLKLKFDQDGQARELLMSTHPRPIEFKIAGKWGSLPGKGSGKGGSKGGGKGKRPREDENNLYGKALMALRALYMTKAK